jgi:hypothetical protein
VKEKRPNKHSAFVPLLPDDHPFRSRKFIPLTNENLPNKHIAKENWINNLLAKK